MTELIIRVNFPGAKESDAELFGTDIIESLKSENLDATPLHINSDAGQSKSGFVLDWNTILVSLLASGGVLTGLITLLENRLSRFENRSLTLEIDGDKLTITGVSDETQKKLVQEWIKRQSKKGKK